MNPKEKALELYSKYEFVYIQNYTSSHEAKQCALIVVDEMLKTLSPYLGDNNARYYWEKVKQEINNI